MRELIGEVRTIVNAEMERANVEFPLFRSDHEGLGLIMKEAFEASNAGDAVTSAFKKLSAAVFDGNQSQAIAIARILESRAILTACEYIQVAAMGKKFALPGREVEEDDKNEHFEFVVPSFLEGNKDVEDACKRLAEVIEKAIEEDEDAE